MAENRGTDLTGLLAEARQGNAAALEAVFEATYAQLRRIAGGIMRRERAGHTLQPTALVHDAWLKLVAPSRVDWCDRAHFLNVAGRAMRQILVDHARRRGAGKRIAGDHRVTFDELAGHGAVFDVEVLGLHEALERFAHVDPRGARVVEGRVFGGMTVQEIAHVLDVSTRTVEMDWTAARRWLARELRGDMGGPASGS